jgi:predicted extracellular nuclease
MFSKLIEKYNPQAGIAMIGDFNAHIEENAMRVLGGDIFTNMIKQLDPSSRYTTNHNGNSQALDYILVNDQLLHKKGLFEVVHLNSDFMGRLSDHDPVMGIFDF